jgi:peptidoglycan DL-endopeptidase CwlO
MLFPYEAQLVDRLALEPGPRFGPPTSHGEAAIIEHIHRPRLVRKQGDSPAWRHHLGVILLALLAFGGASFSLQTGNLAQASPQDVSRAKQEAANLAAQVDDLRSRVEVAVEQYDKAVDGVRTVNAAVVANQAKLESAKRDLRTAHSHLEGRVTRIYKAGGTGLLGALLSSGSLNDLLNRLSLLSAVANQDARLLAQVKTYDAAVTQCGLALDADRRRQVALVAQSTKAKTQVESLLAESTKALKGKEQQVAQLEKEEAARVADARRQAEAAQQAEAARQALTAASSSSRGDSRGNPVPVSDAGTSAPSLPTSGKGASVIQLARQYLGVPYLWGGESPGGFDCSGLVQYVFRKVGVELPRVAADQQGAGVAVSRDQLQPGDLVFFGSPAHHVGIYVGDGTMINAPYSGTVVRFDTINRSHYSGARRVL